LAFEPKYLATSGLLDNKQNLIIVKALEEAIVEVAKREGFQAIIAMNAAIVTQHIAINSGYERVETTQGPLLSKFHHFSFFGVIS